MVERLDVDQVRMHTQYLINFYEFKCLYLSLLGQKDVFSMLLNF